MTTLYSVYLPLVAGLRGVRARDKTEGEMWVLRGHGTKWHLDPPPCVPSMAPSYFKSLPASVLLLGSTVLRDALGSQLSQHVIQVIGIWVTVASEVRAKLCLVMDLIPDDGI